MVKDMEVMILKTEGCATFTRRNYRNLSEKSHLLVMGGNQELPQSLEVRH